MKIRYYDSYTDDFVKTRNQDYELKENYKWIHNNIFYKIFSYILYYTFLLFSLLYIKIVYRVSYKNRKVLKGYKSYFMFSNHTLPFGDAIIPLITNFPNRPYYVADKANLGIPILGKLLPMLGILPIPNTVHKMQSFVDSVNYQIEHNHPIIIYPEAHVWPYNTFIREFPKTSFNFPVSLNVPSFTSTTTFQKSKIFKKPKVVIYIDGPFYPDKNLTKKEQISNLHCKIYNNLVSNSQHSNQDYIKYVKN